MSDFFEEFKIGVEEMFGAVVCTIGGIMWGVVAVIFLPIWTVINRERAGELFTAFKLYWKAVRKLWLRQDIDTEEVKKIEELLY